MIPTVVLAVIYGWIYASTDSLFAVVVFHILQDLSGEIFSIEGAERIELVLWTTVAVAVTLLLRDMALTRRPA